MKLQLNFQIVRFLNYKQTFSDALPLFPATVPRALPRSLSPPSLAKGAHISPILEEAPPPPLPELRNEDRKQ